MAVNYNGKGFYNIGPWWHAGAVSLLSDEAILAWLACPLNDVIFCLL
jgi:hypothetical protein